MRTRLSMALAIAASIVPATPATAHPIGGNGGKTNSTSYCLRGLMANGQYTHAGSLAHNGLRLGTRVRVYPRVFGRRFWTVHDRIGYGTSADFWAPSCQQARAFGRRNITIRVIRVSRVVR